MRVRLQSFVVLHPHSFVALDVQKVSFVMEQFEKNFEDVEVASDVVEQSMTKLTSNMAAQTDVDDLIRQVADEYSLELKLLLPAIAEPAGPFFFSFVRKFFPLTLACQSRLPLPIKLSRRLLLAPPESAGRNRLLMVDLVCIYLQRYEGMNGLFRQLPFLAGLSAQSLD